MDPRGRSRPEGQLPSVGVVIRTLTPNPSFDHTYRVEGFVVGEVNRAETVTVAAAGKGVNVARDVVANDGGATAIVPANTADGIAFLDELAAHAVGCEIVPRPDPTRRNITVVDELGVTSKINESGAALVGDVAEAVLAAAAAEPDGLLAACGSLGPGTDPDFYVQLARRLPAPEQTLVIDTSGAALRACLDMPCLLAKPNRAELEELVGVRLSTYGELIDVAHDLVERGWANILVTLGPAGAILVNRRGAWAGAAPVDRAVNTVGAGDAAVAGFVLEPGGDVAALSSALASARAAVRSPDTAGMRISAADRAAVSIHTIDRSEFLGENTG